MRILFTGGGTGGHIYPILAVAEKLAEKARNKKIEVNFYYIGVPGDYAKLLGSNNIKVSKIISVKLRRYFDLRNLIDILKLPFALLQAFWKVFFLMPDVLFSKGGPGALAVVLACKFYNIPIIIHESDAVAGLTNLISSRYANRIGISFGSGQESFVNYFKNEAKKEKIAAKIAFIGNPIRSDLIKENGDQSTAKKLLGFDSQKPLIAVICGSQGSARVNDFLLSAAKDLVSENFQILHQTGVNNFENFNRELGVVLEGAGVNRNFYKTAAYFDDMKKVYKAADLIVSRAGSGSIFEISAMAKPSILIPLSDSAGDHQKKNAYEYAKNGSAVVIEENNLTAHIFISQIKKLFGNSEILKKMSEAAKNFSKPNAAELIAEEIIKLGTEK